MQRRGRPNRQPRGGGGPDSQQATRSNNHQHNRTRQQRPRAEYHSVPPHAAIKPGSGVAIILKADQPTGHRVNGIVAEHLTRGDHPRGVKVRLRDGRVGRVQALISDAEGERGETLVGGSSAGLGRNGESASNAGMERSRGGRTEKDIREEDDYLYDEAKQRPDATQGLFKALEEADRRHVESSGMGVDPETRPEGLKSTVTICPVCGDFEGDETAVSFHVESHFRD